MYRAARISVACLLALRAKSIALVAVSMIPIPRKGGYQGSQKF